ncbi:MAG: hypothetical protein KKH94_09555 [Candidatus Omnitrophica bacterium]|nr:hypothetical protein [Candidatus Omnitrophota bacterium]
MDKWLSGGLWAAAIVFLGKLFFWDSIKRKAIYEWATKTFMIKEVCTEKEKRNDERNERMEHKLDIIESDVKKLLAKNGIK